ncbi:Outer membrane protein F [Erwinia amylovora MR1]|nr:Outer membrane protein F [Erwinia amylovora MR1]
MMKRNILAVLIPALLAAGAANAAEIYNKDGNKLDLYGKVDARHQFSDNSGEDGDESYVRFGFKGETQISDRLTGYGQWEYNVQANVAEAEGTSGSKTRVGFAGLKFADYGSFDYGRNYGVGYDPLAWTDVLPVFGGDSGYSDNGMVGRSNGLATYRNSNFFGLVDGLDFALQYQGKNEKAITVVKLKKRTATVGAAPLPILLRLAWRYLLLTPGQIAPTLSRMPTSRTAVKPLKPGLPPLSMTQKVFTSRRCTVKPVTTPLSAVISTA